MTKKYGRKGKARVGANVFKRFMADVKTQVYFKKKSKHLKAIQYICKNYAIMASLQSMNQKQPEVCVHAYRFSSGRKEAAAVGAVGITPLMYEIEDDNN